MVVALGTLAAAANSPHLVPSPVVGSVAVLWPSSRAWAACSARSSFTLVPVREPHSGRDLTPARPLPAWNGSGGGPFQVVLAHFQEHGTHGHYQTSNQQLPLLVSNRGLSNGTPPDIAFLLSCRQPASFTDLSARGRLLPLTTRRPRRADRRGRALAAFTSILARAAVWRVLQSPQERGFWYQPALFPPGRIKAPPGHWDELLADAAALRRALFTRTRHVALRSHVRALGLDADRDWFENPTFQNRRPHPSPGACRPTRPSPRAGPSFANAPLSQWPRLSLPMGSRHGRTARGPQAPVTRFCRRSVGRGSLTNRSSVQPYAPHIANGLIPASAQARPRRRAALPRGRWALMPARRTAPAVTRPRLVGDLTYTPLQPPAPALVPAARARPRPSQLRRGRRRVSSASTVLARPCP